MNIRKVLGAFLSFILVVVLVACESDIKGKGEVQALDSKEVQSFANDETGFLYVRPPVSSHHESDTINLREIERIADDQKIDFKTFDEHEHQTLMTEDLNIDLQSQSIGFFLDGEKKAELELSDTNEDQVSDEITQFIKTVEHDYFQ